MDLRIGFGLGIYYVLLFLIFLGLNGLADDYGLGDINATTNIDINNSEITDGEIDRAGFWSVGVSFERFLSWSTFSVFLPENSPQWFVEIFTIWQGIVNLLAIMWVIASIWNG